VVQKRFASITTIRKSEFLVINAERTNLKGRVTEDRALQTRVEIIKQSKLLSTTVSDPAMLGALCKFKSYPFEATFAVENTKSDFLYFIRSGSCSVIKEIQILRSSKGAVTYTLVDGTPMDPGQNQATLSNYHYEKSVFIEVGELNAGDWFGEGIFDASEAVSKSFLNNCYATIKAKTRLDVMMVLKSDLERYATEKTWKVLKEHSKEIDSRELHEAFTKVMDWQNLKASVMNEVINA
jgi:CRP-like cAMP-binding protein